jgi:hypothetical protein
MAALEQRSSPRISASADSGATLTPGAGSSVDRAAAF